MDATIYERDLSGKPVSWRGLTAEVNSLEWDVMGGSRAASVTVYGNTGDLWEVLQWLRCPLVIWDERKKRVWCGYVNESQVRVGAIELRAGLATMINKVAVAYSYVEPGTATVGLRKTTAWAEDTTSIGAFGTKERLSSQSGLSDAAAEALRDAILAAQKWPQATTSQNFGASRGRMGFSGADNSQSATLYGVGWWRTLDWRYASESASSTTLDVLIDKLLDDYGQFFSSVLISGAATTTVDQYRDGDTTAMKEIEALMKGGGANERRLISRVDAERRAWVEEEPSSASGPTVYLGLNGQFTNQLGTVLPADEIVGKWCRLRDPIPLVNGNVMLINPGMQFIESVTWDSSSGTKAQFRGQPGVDQFLAQLAGTT